jgi:hypothetical protein
VDTNGQADLGNSVYGIVSRDVKNIFVGDPDADKPASAGDPPFNVIGYSLINVNTPGAIPRVKGNKIIDAKKGARDSGVPFGGGIGLLLDATIGTGLVNYNEFVGNEAYGVYLADAATDIDIGENDFEMNGVGVASDWASAVSIDRNTINESVLDGVFVFDGSDGVTVAQTF